MSMVQQRVAERPGRMQPRWRSDQDNSVPSLYQHSLHPMFQIHREMGRLIEDAFRVFGFPTTTLLSGLNLPATSIWRHDNGIRPGLNSSSDESCYEISLEVPGLNESDVSIEVRGGVLNISEQKLEQVEDKDRHFYRVECSFGTFQRSLSLPDDANSDEIQASMKDGVLRLVVPRFKAPGSEVKKIAIQ